MVPSVRRPCARLENRCSTTCEICVVVWPLDVDVLFSSGSVTTFVTQREAVWKGAWGMRPLGKGIPRRPATPVVRPRRKMSLLEERRRLLRAHSG